MLSAMPAIFSTEPVLDNPFPSFENGFTPWEWDCSDLFMAIQSSPKPVESNRTNQTNSNSGSDEPISKREVSVVEERKRRRMISNRESARRSRMRKQKHVENLRNQVNRLRIENRELTNRLQFVLFNYRCVQTDNDWLRSEHSMLRQKLSEIRQILLFRQLQQYSPPA